MINVDEAQSKILARAMPLPSETVYIGDAHRRVVAESVTSLRALPPRDNSAMDGYGVIFDDVESASTSTPTTLVVVGLVKAGDDADVRPALQRGQAVRIMTGATIPEGVDTVVMREDTDEASVDDDTGTVRINASSVRGANIRRRGEDVDVDTVIAEEGQVMTPARINLVAQAGHVVARVHRRPVVAILASGDEIREIGTSTGEDDIVNSNAHAIASMVREAGGLPQMMGIASDTLEDHVRRIGASQFADVLITIGGVSMGTHDFVRPALDEVGAELSFWKIAMRPGKPLAFGRRGHQLIFGLPGNPVSSQVTFELFVRPALLAMAGRTDVIRRPVTAIVKGASFKKKSGLTFFARGTVALVDGTFSVTIHDKQGSGQISGLASSNALVQLHPDTEMVHDGDAVSVLLLDDSPFLSGVLD